MTMTNQELLDRLNQGLGLCPEEHVANADEAPDGTGSTRYWLMCGEDLLYEVHLPGDRKPDQWFMRWAAQHEADVAKHHLRRVLESSLAAPSWREAVEARLVSLERASHSHGPIA